MRLITIGIPTKEGIYYKELLYSLYKSIQLLSDEEWKFEIIFCINGPRSNETEYKIRLIIDEFPELNIKIITQEPNCVGKPLAMKRITAEASGDLVLFLDDDVEIDHDTIKNSINIFEIYPNIKLVGATPKVVCPAQISFWRRIIFDILNIQHTLDLFVFPDPFIIGRFMMLQKKDMPIIPVDVIKDDMYLQILFYPNISKIKSYVKYRGVIYLKDYYTRLFRLIEGEQQELKNISGDQLRKYFDDPLMKRRLDFNKIIHLRPYFLFCFICYRLIKLSAFLLQPLFFNKNYVSWKRTN